MFSVLALECFMHIAIPPHRNRDIQLPHRKNIMIVPEDLIWKLHPTISGGEIDQRLLDATPNRAKRARRSVRSRDTDIINVRNEAQTTSLNSRTPIPKLGRVPMSAPATPSAMNSSNEPNCNV